LDKVRKVKKVTVEKVNAMGKVGKDKKIAADE